MTVRVLGKEKSGGGRRGVKTEWGEAETAESEISDKKGRGGALRGWT